MAKIILQPIIVTVMFSILTLNIYWLVAFGLCGVWLAVDTLLDIFSID
ncbi:MAG: hypothetical protein ABL933_11320 [Methyloglobulus sp.]|nr:hypothetical protein [Methyloglobulus sp.]